MDGLGQVEALTPASKLRCDLITNFSQLEELSADWDRLWRTDPDGEIFQSFGWAHAWWRSYGHKISLRTLVVFEGERVLGILPLVKDGEQIVFLGGKQADYCAIVCDNDRAVEVFEAALDRLLELPDWRECVLSNLTLEGRILKQLATLPHRLRRHLRTVYVDDCYTILLNENRDALVALLGKHHTKRRLNKLRKAGTVTFRHIESKVEAQAQLSEFLRHQMQTRALAGKSGIPVEFCSFLRNLIDELDLSRELRFGVLELNDRPLAWHLSFHVNDKLLFYQQTFDVDRWDYSPGEVLVHELLRYVNEKAIREFDFAHGDEPFKNRFTTDTRKCYSLYIERSGISGQLRRVFRASLILWNHLVRKAVGLAKRNDKIFQRSRSIRLWWAGVLARARRHREKGTLTHWAVCRLAGLLSSRPFGGSPVYFFSPDYVKEKPVAVVSDSRVSVSAGTLGDLVDISLQYPELLVPSELAKCRRRLKKGDRVYLVREGEQVVLFAWTTAGSRSDASRQVPAQAPLMILEECWAVSKFPKPAYYRDLLCALSQEAKSKQKTLGIGCLDRYPVLRSEVKNMESVGA